jgi:hypothetical protein
METQSPLQKRVMRRVYTVYVWRKIARPRTLKAFVLASVLAGITSLVSLPNVVANMPGDPLMVLNFFAAAFVGTEMVVQLLSVVMLAVTLWLMRDFFTPQYA